MGLRCLFSCDTEPVISDHPCKDMIQCKRCGRKYYTKEKHEFYTPRNGALRICSRCGEYDNPYPAGGSYHG